MVRNKQSTDGFMPRRPAANLGEYHAGSPTPNANAMRTDHSVMPSEKYPDNEPRYRVGIARGEIDESLRGIDNEPEAEKKKGRFGRRSGLPTNRRRKIIKWVIIAFLVLLLAVGGWLAYKALSAGGKIFQGNILDVLKNEPLKQDANGRSNILIFGTAEDDENGEHGGANLTDSIMVLSIDQNKKDAYMISIPRDLWVQYQSTCTVGNQGKINAAYFCASNNGEDEKAGAAALQEQASTVLGIDVQYFVHLNFTAVTDAVNAVGGVDVKIESEDPRGILDRNFDWKCNYKCYYVNYKNGETVHLNGERALALARARNASGGYGLPNGNFDREKNQQKIIVALKEKAMSAGTLTDVGKVTSLIDALGNNLRTNFENKEIRTLMSLGTDIKSENIQSISLNEDGNAMVTTGNVGGQSIVRPIAGLMDYSEIHSFIEERLTSDPVVKEKANVVVLNGSGKAGAAQTEADKLDEAGLVITSVANAPAGTYEKIEVYKIGDSAANPASTAKLEELYGIKVKAGAPPAGASEGTDFVVIVGAAS